MTVLHLINGLGPGGTERSLVELLPHYARAGVHSLVVHLKDRDEGYQSEVERLGAGLVRLPGSTLRTWVPAFRRMVHTLRPDVVHTALWESHLVGRLGCAGRGIPVVSSLVTTADDPTSLEARPPRTVKRRLAETLDRWTGLRWTTRYHAVAEAVRDSYVRRYGIPPERIAVVPRGRSRERLGEPTPARRAAARARWGIAPEAPLLVTTGRHEAPKGHPVLLDALAHLRETVPEARLLVLGREGATTNALRARIERLGLQEHVRLMGHRDDALDLVAAADVFVFPSFREGAAGALLEAMALGRAIVASDIPALREPIEPGVSGVLVEPGDAGAFAAETASLLADPARREALGSAARARFDAEYTIERSAERMLALYRSVVEESR